MAVIKGTPGNDSLAGTLNDDLIFGFGGHDTVQANAGADTVRGGFGNDVLGGEAGDDLMFGQDGADTLSGGTGLDRLFGDAGADVLLGGGGADQVDGGDGGDQLVGGDGADTLYGRAGDDSLNGGLRTFNPAGDAPDRLFGGDGNDSLLSNDADRDTLFGEDGDDGLTINNDVARGGAGDDFVGIIDLFGAVGTGDNDVTLGTGADTVGADLLDAGTSGSTTIRDFGAQDKFTASLFNVATQEDVRSTLLFNTLDRNDDDVINARDDGSTVVDGFTLAVDVAGGNTSFDLDGATFTFQNVTAISADQWLFTA